MIDENIQEEIVAKNRAGSENAEGWSKGSKLSRYIAAGLCLVMFAMVIVHYFVPVLITSEFSLTPYTLMTSEAYSEIDFGIFVPLIVSYYIYKYFYMIFAVAACFLLFLTLYFFVTNNKNFFRNTSYIICAIVVFLFISMFAGFNYINVYSTIYPSIGLTTLSPVFFVIGLVLLIAKIIIEAVLCKSAQNDELKESGLSIANSFVLLFLTLGALFFPLYIFPGTRYRMTGFNILTGKADVLSFLPMSSVYKVILIVFTAVVAASFLTNLACFVLKRKIFVQYNKVNNFLGITALTLYALMGLNYMLVYVDAYGYNTFFNTSMNTYSFIPIALYGLFLAGSLIARLTLSKLTVEYKVYTKPDEKAAENAQAESDLKTEDKSDASNGNDSNAVDQDKKDGDDVIPLSAAGDAKKEEEAVKEEPEKELYDPIPAFSELDRREEQYANEYLLREEHINGALTLPNLVSHVIEYAKYSRERLSYGPVEVKTFMAGLAASRLSILQGMSGTGKTSLPKIFMEAINGFCEIVAVESSWRDKNELLGYYNEFNKKYTPKSFTQFLYKASLNRNVPYFIVLDEMNLSRIEYYFSDFLSLMEARENMRYIKLFDVQLYPHIDEREQYTVLRDGHTIDIPANVWFIGTANRDESTFEISDKVYDRAQTMNFDKRAAKVKITEEKDYPKIFVPYTQLRQLFNASKSVAFDAESYDAIKKTEILLRPYKISFGNRVLKQIEEFVNAYVACSEIANEDDLKKFTHEAVDCIVFSKVVRKLELKQVLDVDTLIDEFTNLKMTKCVEFLHTLVEA